MTPPPTWSEVMRWTHQDHGVRAEEHFTTSIDIGDHVARFVLHRCRAAAQRHGIAAPWIVDVGAGRGRLLEQLLNLGFPAERLLGVDVRPAPNLPVRWIRGVAPACLPEVEGLVIAHEFLDDVPTDVVRQGYVEMVDGSIGPQATPAQTAWAQRWGDGVNGASRDEAWAGIVACVHAGEAIAVDFTGGEPVGHLRGRRTVAVPDGRDLCAGVDFRSLRQVAGGRVVPQHRLFPKVPVLADRGGLGAFLWLITDVPRSVQRQSTAGGPSPHPGG